MNNSKTPKIVVGVGLAAVYATIAAFLIPRGEHDNIVAQNATTAPAAEVASEPALPPPLVSEDASTTANEQPAPAVAAPAPVAAAPVAVAASKASAAPAARKAETKPQLSEQPVARQEPIAEERPIASVATTPPAAEREVEEPSLASAGSADVDESEATEEVTSQVATATSDGTTDTATEDGAELSN